MNRPVDIMMTPWQKSETFLKLQKHGMLPTNLIDNVQDLINAEKKAKLLRKKPFKMTWDDYYTYDEVQLLMKYFRRYQSGWFQSH